VKASVLVVDDNPSNGALYQRVIKNVPNADAHTFSRPEEALAWAREHHPLLVVVDYRMPAMNGFAFIRALRMIPGRSSVPCVMLTAVKEDDVRREALELGVVEFLTKPVNPERLIALVAQAISHAR
jgi:CheY-like chemotaxis protein